MRQVSTAELQTILLDMSQLLGQLSDPAGYPYDPEDLQRHLEAACRGEFYKIVPYKSTHILTLDRSQVFNAKYFTGKPKWKIINSNDLLLKDLSEIDLESVRLEKYLVKGELLSLRDEKIEGLKSRGFIFLDALIYKALADNPKIIPPGWKQLIAEDDGIITFDGSTLISPANTRNILFINLGLHNTWHFHPRNYLRIGARTLRVSQPFYSAVLAPRK